MGLNEDAVRKRIEIVRRTYKWTENSLAKDGATQKRLNRQLSHGGAITLDTILLILNACPEVSADWLLLGRGDMQQEPCRSDLPEFGGDGTLSPDQVTNFHLIALLEQKNRHIDRLIDLLSLR